MSLVLNQPKNLVSSVLKLFTFTKESAVVNSLTDKINIFLTVDQSNIHEHFNLNDPAPLYKRQLSHQFQQYIMTSIEAAKRHSVFCYKINCKNKSDRQYTEAVIYSIRRHFSAKKLIKIEQFEKFKRRSYMLLFSSLAVVMVCHGVVPYFLPDETGFYSALRNGLDIFSWVILWQPIDKLVFQWNPHLKDISMMNRLANAEVIITENA
ncbi:MAG: hypothetical protein M3139_02765 [Bacteroidota bacterium]|nr:hypothetical protein [Bacteroidota bacterium]